MFKYKKLFENQLVNKRLNFYIETGILNKIHKTVKMSLTKKNLNVNKDIKTIIDIDELHKQAISMLKDVKKVLDKHRLVYWIEDGTLLGYMRNKKIIPWDDEIDLGTYANKFPKIKKLGLT